MSKIKLTGHASGSGVLTIAAPNTDTDRTITLPDVTGTLLDSGSDLPAANLTGALPAISGANLTNLTSTFNGLTDVSMDITNFTDSILIQTDSDGSAPTTGTLSSASYNVGIGKDVFAALTSGTENIAIGKEALMADTTGASNVAIGGDSLQANTTGGDNVAVGRNTLQANTTASNNTAIGKSSLALNVTGTRNTAVGSDSYLITQEVLIQQLVVIV